MFQVLTQPPFDITNICSVTHITLNELRPEHMDTLSEALGKGALKHCTYLNLGGSNIGDKGL